MMKNRNKTKRVVKMTSDQTKSDEVTLKHTGLHTDTHTPTHTLTHTPLMPTTADTGSVPSGVSHEASEEDLDRRFHRRLVGPLPCESLNAGQMPSACRNRSDRDAPSNAEPGDGETPQHSRDLEDGIKGPYEQPWQRNVRLRRRDDWYSNDSDQESIRGAVRSGNREPRYYRDGEIPVSRMEIVSSRQPHQEPEVTLQAASPSDVSTAQVDFRFKMDVNPQFSTIGATERGAKSGIESINDAQHGFREEATPSFSTILDGLSRTRYWNFQNFQPGYLPVDTCTMTATTNSSRHVNV